LQLRTTSKTGGTQKGVKKPFYSLLIFHSSLKNTTQEHNILRRFKKSYSSDIAFTGHTPAQDPQLTQMLASITCFPFCSEIAETGHSAVQASQLMQALEIL